MAEGIPGAISVAHCHECIALEVVPTIVGLCMNPNIRSVVLVVMGRQGQRPEPIAEQVAKTGRPVQIINIHEIGNTRQAIARECAAVTAIEQDTALSLVKLAGGASALTTSEYNLAGFSTSTHEIVNAVEKNTYGTLTLAAILAPTTSVSRTRSTAISRGVLITASPLETGDGRPHTRLTTRYGTSLRTYITDSPRQVKEGS